MKASFYVSKLVILLVILSGVSFSANSQTTVFSYTGAIQTYTVPAGVTQLQITASGAQGGDMTGAGGVGAIIQGIVTVTPGQVLKIIVGQQGQSDLSETPGDSENPYGNGGGGGSFVTTITNDPLIIAGGGGGAGVIHDAGQAGQLGTNGGSLGTSGELGGSAGSGGDVGVNIDGCGGPGHGGGGLLGDGSGPSPSGGLAFVNGGTGGTDNNVDNCVVLSYGGFGGGGAGGNGGGGGGGYSGGAGGTNTGGHDPGGGGGGSYNGGTSQSNTIGNTGDGVVTITIPPPTFVNGSPQSLTACLSSAVDLGSLLTVNDINVGITLTWSVVSGPSNGSLGGFNGTAASTGGNVTPTGLTYTATSGNTDAFTIMVDDGNGNSVTTTINVNIPTPTITVDSTLKVCPGSTSSQLFYSGLVNVPAAVSYPYNGMVQTTATLPYSGSIQTWTVPVGVTKIHVSAKGAQGGGATFYTSASGGTGAIMTGDFAVTPGQVLNILVGGQGQTATNDGGGGGGSFVWDNASTTLLVAAGGGGGAGIEFIDHINLPGIDATTANDGVNGYTMTSGAGTAGNGGTVPTGYESWAGGGAGWLSNGNDGVVPVFACGSLCTGGITALSGGTGGTHGGYTGENGDGGFGGGGGANGRCDDIGGGGGGGYSGGGAGGEVTTAPNDFFPAGGGGGSYNAGDNQLNSVGNTGDGQIVISYVAATYSITWDGTAAGQGFVDATDSPMSSSPMAIPVSGTAVSGTYNGTLTVSNGTCSSTAQPISVTIYPVPDVAPIASPAPVCVGLNDTIRFSGSVPGTTYSWTNSNSDIGLGLTGGGDITFITANSTNINDTAVINVTAMANGCVGPVVQTFTITVKPDPTVNGLTNQFYCNNTMSTSTVFSGTVANSHFDWIVFSGDTTIGMGSHGTDSIGAFLAVNDSTYSLTANIQVRPNANGCVSNNTATFTITAKPTPRLTNPANPPLCDSSVFDFTPNSSITDIGVTTFYDWQRDTAAGNPATFGTGGVSEFLVNTTTDPVLLTYIYHLEANSCLDTENVTVVVNPTPMLNTPGTPAAICDSTLFSYGPGSATANTSYVWSRDTAFGITNAPATGVDSINEVLENITADPIAVVYVYTLTANGCTHTQSISVTVNPKPTLLGSLSLGAICDSTFFVYNPNSATTGTTYSWTRAVVTGISNPVGSGVDSINEKLVNTTANPVAVTYLVTLTANGCSNTQPITVTVNPTPRLTSSLTPPSLCDSAIFNYTPTSATSGTTYNWSRAYVLGINLPAGTGHDNPNEQLINNTNDNLDVTYLYTLSANGCSNTQKVTVVVHPTPTLSSMLTTSTCSEAPFFYMPTGYVFGTTYKWVRGAVSGLTPATDTGSGNIHDTITNSLLVPKVTMYTIILTANGCSHVQTVTVTVNPTPPGLEITTHSSSSLCSGTFFQNFGTSTVPPADQSYDWAATNATVWATGDNNQYCLVSFPTAGDAYVTLKSSINGYGCIRSSSFQVSVGTGVSDNPEVIYHGGQLMVLQNDADTYQWGYDDATTLDSTLIPGEINPNYFISSLDVAHLYYWVITTHNGCSQKSYYNLPVGITTLNPGAADVKIYPNPTNDYVNVDINTTMGGNFEVQVLNLLGQKLNTTMATDHKARIDVANLPSGCYLVDCYREGVKIAAARFIKN